MRLLRLYIGEHRVLCNLDIRFDPAQPQADESRQYHLDFLVGVNGTGKSTVLRLVGQIFRGVQASSTLEIPFILEYWLDSQKKKVRISNIDPAIERRCSIAISSLRLMGWMPSTKQKNPTNST